MKLEKKFELLKENHYMINECVTNVTLWYDYDFSATKPEEQLIKNDTNFENSSSEFILYNNYLLPIYTGYSYEEIIEFIDKTDIRTLVDKNYMKLEDKLQILNSSDFKIRESLSNAVVHFDYPRIEEKMPPEPTTPADMYLDACHTSYQLLNNKNEIIYTNKVYANIIDYIDKNDINIILNNLK